MAFDFAALRSGRTGQAPQQVRKCTNLLWSDLAQARGQATGTEQQENNTEPRVLVPDAQGEAEAYFLKAIEIAQHQQAKSLELRAVISLVRLRQHQAQNHEARDTQHEARIRLDEALKMLADIYGWFTEGFDTKDLQEAKLLLEKLGH